MADAEVAPDRGTPGVADPRAFPPVLTAAMAAELLQVHVEYLRKMVREGRVPAHRFPGGRELRFLRDELIGWLGALPGPSVPLPPPATRSVPAAQIVPETPDAPAGRRPATRTQSTAVHGT